MIPEFLWSQRWARRLHGGKWELWGARWVPVKEWSSPRDRPTEYGRGELPEREDWG